MRAQLHAERPALERLLYRVEQQPTDAFERAHLARQLRQFNFLERLPLTLSDERALQDRYVRAVETITSTMLGQGDSVGALLTTIARDVNPSARILDGALLASCERITHTINRLKGTLTASDRATLASLLESRAASVRTALAERTRDAYTCMPTLVQQRGYAPRRAEVAVTAYTTALTRVEGRMRELELLAQTLRTAPNEQSGTTLIMNARDPRARDTLERTCNAYGRVVRFKHVSYLALMTDDTTAQELLTRPTAFNVTGSVYRERIYSVTPFPAAELDPRVWNIGLVNAPAAWQRTRGAGATVAIIDTGADYLHRDLAERFTNERGANFVGYGEPMDDNGHGTHVSGTIAGVDTGVAPEAQLYAVKVLNADGYGTETAVLQGIEWAIDKNVHAINMSLGSSYGSDAERELIAIAAKQGISIACAAGNDGDAGYNYPASYEGATSVAAVDYAKRRAPFSNYNDCVDVAAPGVAVYSCFPNDQYETLSGTSMATPHVAGAYALLASVGIAEREKILLHTAQQLGDHNEYGAGLIDCAAAIGVATAARTPRQARKL